MNVLRSGHVKVYRYSNNNNESNQPGDGVDGEAAFDNFGVSVALSWNDNIVAIDGSRNGENGDV